MYRSILPYNSHRDQSHVQGHNHRSDRARRSTYVPLARSIPASAQRLRSALRRSLRGRATRPSMNWWD